MSSRARAFSLVIYGFDTHRPPHGPCPPSNQLVNRLISDNDAAPPAAASHSLCASCRYRTGPRAVRRVDDFTYTH